jgi:hypothetical protein
MIGNGKAEPYRTVRRQSRSLRIQGHLESSQSAERTMGIKSGVKLSEPRDPSGTKIARARGPADSRRDIDITRN